MRLIFICLFSFLIWSEGVIAQNQQIRVRLSGNAYVTSETKGPRITGKGLTHWGEAGAVVSVYFYLHEAGTVDLSLRAKGDSEIEVAVGKDRFPVQLSSADYMDVAVGKTEITSPGYVRVDLKGIRKNGDSFGEIQELIVGGVKGKVTHVTDFGGNSDYWGRRGPSVHLAYTLPKDTVEWFYNEVTVPKEGEVRNTYYMANGFGEGYFGMQFNSETERRVLFSVWSPFSTQDPRSIPEDSRIKMLRKGEGVHIGEFGNEGSGGQSYLVYNWKAGVTYRFLMQVHPDGKGNTVYTAYFYAADENRWRLIASFLRPKTDTWYKGAHSFLENFSPEQGYLTRSVFFDNQWVRSKGGEWQELRQSSFTYDGTASAGVRLDYQGGADQKRGFYLKNCGFFNESTPYHSRFERTTKGKQPKIDFGSLEKL